MVHRPNTSAARIDVLALLAVVVVDVVLVGRTKLDGVQAVGVAGLGELCTCAPVVRTSLDEQTVMSSVPKKGCGRTIEVAQSCVSLIN